MIYLHRIFCSTVLTFGLEQDMKTKSHQIKSLKESEKEHLNNVLEKTHWDLSKTSRLLKISLQQLKSKITAYGLKPSGSKRD